MKKKLRFEAFDRAGRRYECDAYKLNTCAVVAHYGDGETRKIYWFEDRLSAGIKCDELKKQAADMVVRLQQAIDRNERINTVLARRYSMLKHARTHVKSYWQGLDVEIVPVRQTEPRD